MHVCVLVCACACTLAYEGVRGNHDNDIRNLCLHYANLEKKHGEVLLCVQCVQCVLWGRG